MNGGSQNIYVQQQQWNGYPAFDQVQQRNYNYYGSLLYTSDAADE